MSLLAGLHAQFSQYLGNKQTLLSVAEKEPLFFLLDSSVPTLCSLPRRPHLSLGLQLLPLLPLPSDHKQ